MTGETSCLNELEVCRLSATEIIDYAEKLVSTGCINDAILLYKTWIPSNLDSSLVHVIAFNLGVLLANDKDPYSAGIAFSNAIHVNPAFLPAYINLGMALESLGHPSEALLRWHEVLSQLNNISAENVSVKATTLKQIARLLSNYKVDERAEEALHASLELLPSQRDILHHWVNVRQRQCKWPPVIQVNGLARTQIVARLSPLSLAAYTDDPLLQLGVAADYARSEIGRPTRSMASPNRHLLNNITPHRLRIGYLSSDLRAHAIGYLMAEVFELHDRRHVEIFTYYSGPPTKDNWFNRIKYASDAWIDISEFDDDQAAQTISDDRIEILVDVNGYTNGARSGVVAQRPAPIIVNWLGYPGSVGSPYHHYIIADDFIIPPSNEMFYSETVKRLPCYQPNDLCRTIAEKALCRSEAGLPSKGIVYCCFNGSHKITSFTFQRWMEVLGKVPQSVLWLLDMSEGTNERLKAAALRSGIASDRLIFAPLAANAEHLARYALADLFLDTSPYGAHTTASDALWTGLPVLTLSGRSFAARVCGSLVKAAGLPELVCHSSEEYISRAVDLGLNSDKLLLHRRKLQQSRQYSTLFDTPSLVSRLESLFQDMWSEAAHHLMRRPDLSNLNLYREIGAELDSDDVEMGTLPDYGDLYISALSTRHEFDVIRADSRLWLSSSFNV